MLVVRSRQSSLYLLLIVAALLAGCATKTINHILADPSRYRDQEVKVAGSVVDSYSIGNRGVYRVQDSTGSLWVVSDQGVPRTTARVEVRGTIREGFNIGTLGNIVNLPAGIGTGLVLVESSHKATD